MTRKTARCIRIALLSAIPAFFCAAFLPGGANSSETRSFDTVPGDTVIIQNDYGRVQVRVWDSPQVEARIRRFAHDDSHLENVAVVAQKSQDKIFLNAYFYDYQAESVYLEIQVPAFVNVVVWGANPAVEISGLGGYARVYTQTGLITATDLVSSVSLTTESGDILFRSSLQPDGDIRLESIRGRVRCDLKTGLNFRGWLRAGGQLSWNEEVEFSQGQLEKQVGTGGPLIYAASQFADVSVHLNPEQKALAEIPEPEASGSGSGRLSPDLPDSEPRDEETRHGIEEPPRLDSPAPAEADTPAHQPPPGRGIESGGGEVASGYTLTIDVNWTYLHASVRDRYTNRSVPHLSKEDFLIYEDGAEQTVEKFESTQAPFNLLLLLDVSGSTRSYIDMIKEASIEFTRQIKANDRIAVATFNSSARLIQPFTNDRNRVAHSIDRIRSGGGTAFYDALNIVVQDYMDGIEGRKAVVVFTDGVDNQLTGDWSDGSQITFRELFRTIREIDSIIYTIFLDTLSGGSSPWPGPRRGGNTSVIDILGDILKGQARSGMGEAAAYAEAREQLRMIADQTGGRMYAPRDIYDLSGTYREIADDLRVQYTLAYNSSNPDYDGQWREIRVRIRNRTDLVVRSRQGYYASGGGNSRTSSNFMP